MLQATGSCREHESPDSRSSATRRFHCNTDANMQVLCNFVPENWPKVRAGVSYISISVSHPRLARHVFSVT